jgi:Uma2 family endonuclease
MYQRRVVTCIGYSFAIASGVKSMVQQLIPDNPIEVIYPERDGQPMADNTRQFRWIVVIKENLELLFRDRPEVFVAGDLLWYPVEGDNKLRQAPDVLVVFGRPKGDRGSYRQWQEENIPPQVVFEILSPGNRFGEMLRKLEFYQRYGVEEYYLYDPDQMELTGLLRAGEKLELLESVDGWVSPRLQIRFQLTETGLDIYRPDGERFLTHLELAQQREAALAQLDQERMLRAQDQQRILALETKLRELGVEPDHL